MVMMRYVLWIMFVYVYVYVYIYGQSALCCVVLCCILCLYSQYNTKLV